MEVQGLKRALRFLKEKINIFEVVTDTSATIISCLGIVCTCMCVKQHVQPSLLHTGVAANEFPEYHHSLDVWHKSKKLKKSLAEVSSLETMLCQCIHTNFPIGC